MLYQEPIMEILKIQDMILTSVEGFYNPNNPSNDNISNASGDWTQKSN